MQPAGTGPAGTAFVPLGTNTNVTPGSRTSLAWPSRRPNQNYEWFVTVTDAAQNTWTSRLWRFTTTVTNTPPVLTNRSLTLQGDTPTRLLFQATDVNQDPLTYHVIVAPTRGLMQDFDPVTGSFLYVPARGFRGMDRITYRARDGQAFSGIATLNLNVIAPPDANGNGLPDAWELSYGITDPEADDDDDGLSNRQEYWAHTNPTNAASAFRILNAAWQPSGHFALTWASVGRCAVSGAIHRCDSSGRCGRDLYGPATGIELEMDAGPAGVESTQTFADDFTHTGGPPARGARYYRVRITP